MADGRGVVKRIAAERIEILYRAAVDAFPKDMELSREYISMLEEIGRHYKVKIPKGIAAKVCKHCSAPLIEGVNSEIRIIAKDKRIIYRCKKCGSTNSLPFSKPIKGKKS